jgi:hypothetical protein
MWVNLHSCAFDVVMALRMTGPGQDSTTGLPKVIVLNTGYLQRENRFLFKSGWESGLELSILYSYYLFGHACQFCLVTHFNF